MTKLIDIFFRISLFPFVVVGVFVGMACAAFTYGYRIGVEIFCDT